VTRVTFYLLRDTRPQQRLQIAARLADRAFRDGHRIFINTPDETQARELDALLWSFRPTSFLPHALHGEAHADTVAIGWEGDPGDHDDLLINLDLEIPAFFARFRRVAEVVTRDPESLAALRHSYRQYRERGCQLETHEL
jgi:DNA polymerase-3 subunit chi